MDRTLFVFALLVVFGEIEAVQDFCQNKICPEYSVVASNANFEQRLYVETMWITTQLSGSSGPDLTAGFDRLKAFSEQQSKAGVEMSDNAWPVLIRVQDTASGQTYFLSWFVPPGTQLTADSSATVQVESVPASTVYVRSFGGTPSIGDGLSNTQSLRADLEAAGITFNYNVYCGAGYESYFSITHHNEIWIRSN